MFVQHAQFWQRFVRCVPRERKLFYSSHSLAFIKISRVCQHVVEHIPLPTPFPLRPPPLEQLLQLLSELLINIHRRQMEFM